VQPGGPEQTVDAFYAALQSENAASGLSLLSHDAIIFEMEKSDRWRREYAASHLPGDMEIAARTRRELISRTSEGIGDTRWVLSTYREIESEATTVRPSTVTETVILQHLGVHGRLRICTGPHR
jgi:hypothetical protein